MEVKYAILAIAIYGFVVNQSAAQPEECDASIQLKSINDWNYMRGRWYMLYRSVSAPHREFKCDQIQVQVDQSRVSVHALIPDRERINAFNSVTTVRDGDSGLGLTFNYNRYSVGVVDVEYEEYAIIQACPVYNEDPHHNYVYVLSRKPSLSINERLMIDRHLSNRGLPSIDLLDKVIQNCQDIDCNEHYTECWYH